MEITLDLNSYINKEIECSCGHTHFSSVKLIDIDSGASLRLPSHIRKMNYHKVFLVSDRNTWKAAGREAEFRILQAGIRIKRMILDYDELIPNEQVIGEILAAFPMDADLILAVGSGTINDLCKFISSRVHVDYMVFASAPSMDGFVSIGAALMLNHVKTTIDCHGPVAVIGDTDILAKAPMRLIAAGLGDTLGKYTCLLDWKLSHLINGEYYCPEVVGMVEKALQTVIEKGPMVQNRDPEAIKAVTEALVLTGIAMSFTGNSRPASGCEHHLSHYWEMKMLMERKVPALHGEQVGVGLIMMLNLYHHLAKEMPDFDAAKNKPYDKKIWQERIRSVYGTAADGIIQLENKAHKNDVSARNVRIDKIKSEWKNIQLMIEQNLPAVSEVEKLMRSLNGFINAAEIGVSADEVRNAVLYAKEVRDRYTLLQLLWDLGLSEKYAEIAVNYFSAEQQA